MNDRTPPTLANALSQDVGYQRSIEVHNALEALYPRIETFHAFFRAEMPVSAFLPCPPGGRPGVELDPIVCALAIKAATAKRATFTLCESGDGENAMVVVRTLLENAALLEWLIRGDGRERLELFALFRSVAHERVVQTITKHQQRFVNAGGHPQASSDARHAAIWSHTFRENGRPTRHERATWQCNRDTGRVERVSAKDLFEGAQGSFEYDVLYGEIGSEIVHSGPFSLIRIQQRLEAYTTFVLEPMPDTQSCSIALGTSNSAMFLVLDALTEYLGLDLSAELNPLKASFSASRYGNPPTT